MVMMMAQSRAGSGEAESRQTGKTDLTGPGDSFCGASDL